MRPQRETIAATLSHLATKEDVTSIKGGISGVKGELNGKISNLDSKVSALPSFWRTAVINGGTVLA